MTNDSWIQPRFVSLMAVILAGAAVLRLLFFADFEFKGDEVQALAQAEAWLSRGVPQYGILSGAGIRNPPGFMFFLTPLVALTSDPLAITLCVTLLGIASVALLGQVGFSLGGIGLGWRVALLAAAHPWLILYSRKIWAQSLLPFFATLFLLAWAQCLRRERSRAVVWLPILAGVLWQLHFSAFSVLFFLGAWLVSEVVRRRLNWPMLGVGVLVAGLILAPYGSYLASTHFADLRGMGTFRNSGGGAIAALQQALTLWLGSAFAGNFGYAFAYTPAPLTAIPGRPALGWVLEALAVLSSLVVVAAFLRGAWRSRTAEGGADMAAAGMTAAARPWLVVFAILPPVLYLVRGIEGYPHYFIIGLPAVLLLAGQGLRGLGMRVRMPRLALAGVAAPAGLALVGTIIWLGVLGAVRREGGTAGDFGLTFATQRRVAARLVEEGINPAAVHADFMRDRAAGILYLMKRAESRGGAIMPGRQAALIDALLYPTTECRDDLAGARTLREGPVRLCLFGSPPPGDGLR